MLVLIVFFLSAWFLDKRMAESVDAAEPEVRRALEVVQSMIDISANHLEGLRTRCVTSAELTQQEIRTLEVIIFLQYNAFLA